MSARRLISDNAIAQANEGELFSMLREINRQTDSGMLDYDAAEAELCRRGALLRSELATLDTQLAKIAAENAKMRKGLYRIGESGARLAREYGPDGDPE